MQTRSIAHLTLGISQEVKTNTLHRMVTRSKKQSLELQKNKEKEEWFTAYVKKLLNAINNVNDEYYNQSDNIVEKTRIIDEMYYNIDKYLGELIEENPQKWTRFAVALVDKAVELIQEIHYVLHNKGSNRVTEFTRQEKAYLRQVMKQLEKIKNRYQALYLA